ncbi:MAG: hypothetical protein HON92_17870 [Planctomycetaceae bacterium]|nr:hypothetical protein [Planctomycetaceae bacterium]
MKALLYIMTKQGQFDEAMNILKQVDLGNWDAVGLNRCCIPSRNFGRRRSKRRGTENLPGRDQTRLDFQSSAGKTRAGDRQAIKSLVIHTRFPGLTKMKIHS